MEKTKIQSLFKINLEKQVDLICKRVIRNCKIDEFKRHLSENFPDLIEFAKKCIKEFNLNKFGQAIVALLLNHEDRLTKQEQVSEEILKRMDALERENKELKQQCKTVANENRELKKQLNPKVEVML